MSKRRPRVATLAMLALLFGSFWLLPWVNARVGLGVDWQREPSNPFRVYLHLKRSADLERGDYVPFAMHGMAPLIPDDTLFVKQLIGVAGDRLEIRQQALYVNDQRVAIINPVILAKAGLLQSRLADQAVIPEGEVLLLGVAPNSFDSRYFGLIHRTQLRGQALPLW
ncbi:signal peptidase I [Ahniella affigens]|nr:signal peptidase I [Ahniella affigens]